MSGCWLDSYFAQLNLDVDHKILRQIYRWAIQCQAIHSQYMARNQTVDEWHKEAAGFWAEVKKLLPDQSNCELRQLVETTLTPELLASVIIAAPAV